MDNKGEVFVNMGLSQWVKPQCADHSELVSALNLGLITDKQRAESICGCVSGYTLMLEL